MDRTIVIQRATTTVDDYGTPIETWDNMVTLRAQQVQASTDEFIRGFGASDETMVVFRIWWVNGLLTADRVLYNGAPYNIKELKEIGRRNGLELRCVRLT